VVCTGWEPVARNFSGAKKSGNISADDGERLLVLHENALGTENTVKMFAPQQCSGDALQGARNRSVSCVRSRRMQTMQNSLSRLNDVLALFSARATGRLSPLSHEIVRTFARLDIFSSENVRSRGGQPHVSAHFPTHFPTGRKRDQKIFTFLPTGRKVDENPGDNSIWGIIE
jgi:hypothetical protein